MTWFWIIFGGLALAWVVAWSRERRRKDRRDVLKDWRPPQAGRAGFNYDPQPHPRAGFGNDEVAP